jgi:hypothetical protein
MKKLFLYSFLIVVFFSCTKNKQQNISFYHWKAKANFNKSYQNAINIAQSNTIFLHYFDLKLLNKNDWKNDGIYPVYVVRDVSDEFKKLRIIPTIYISNRVFKQQIDIKGLAERTRKLIHQISQKHFQKNITTIQIDCDWTKSTRYAYFEFIKLMKQDFNISVTIRLHQIKFKEKTGIPPVKNGSLMLYNVGDLKNNKQNSILENSIVKQYINTQTKYPLDLSIALPLFSQTIVTNNDNKIKIIKHTERHILENDQHFKKLDDINFTVKIDTLYKGFYLSKGFNLKLEETNEKEIIASYKTIKKSQLKTTNIIFYHLDEQALSTMDLKKIINNL